MSNDERMTKGGSSAPDSSGPKYDLEERTACFGEAVIDFAKILPQNVILTSLLSQLVRAATSIGANYCEADDWLFMSENPLPLRDYLDRLIRALKFR
jgi:hypothetical protein